MVEYIAELRHREEIARSAARRDAIRREIADAVTRLWAQRSHWPQGWPPKTAATLLEHLEAGQKYPFASRPSTGSPWLDTVDDLESIAAEERRLVYFAALLDLGVAHEARVLARMSSKLSDDEREILERLQKLHEEARRSFSREMGDDGERRVDSQRERTGFVAGRLRELAVKRDELLQRATEAARGGSAVAAGPVRRARERRVRRR